MLDSTWVLPYRQILKEDIWPSLSILRAKIFSESGSIVPFHFFSSGIIVWQFYPTVNFQQCICHGDCIYHWKSHGPKIPYSMVHGFDNVALIRISYWSNRSYQIHNISLQRPVQAPSGTVVLSPAFFFIHGLLSTTLPSESNDIAVNPCPEDPCPEELRVITLS